MCISALDQCSDAGDFLQGKSTGIQCLWFGKAFFLVASRACLYSIPSWYDSSSCTTTGGDLAPTSGGQCGQISCPQLFSACDQAVVCAMGHIESLLVSGGSSQGVQHIYSISPWPDSRVTSVQHIYSNSRWRYKLSDKQRGGTPITPSNVYTVVQARHRMATLVTCRHTPNPWSKTRCVFPALLT